MLAIDPHAGTSNHVTFSVVLHKGHESGPIRVLARS